MTDNRICSTRHLFRIWKSMVFGWILMMAAMVSEARQTPDKPNILWIVSEDNSPFIGAYGDTFATTPNLDKMAEEGILYWNAFATAPVCAPSRSTLITGMYPTSIGTENMRSEYPIPEWIHFYPKYLKDIGYYTSNNSKKDYNTTDQPEVWDESGNKATYKNRKENQPFFSIFNLTVSHESSLHEPLKQLHHDPEKVPVPPYHPRTEAFKRDWAQYYDKVMFMDEQVGKILAELEEAGLEENTIVFYYGDHGGVLGRSKRFMYESGLRVPLIIKFPAKYQHLAPGSPGSVTDRIVTFADFAPTIWSLAGIDAPEHIQGKAFLGKYQKGEREYGFAFRGRMDERMDLSRGVRDKKYRYIRNYMPHKIYAQYIEYLWRAPSMQSWEEEYEAGRLNEVQSRFWGTKPAEELYDVENDPDNIHNLADDPKYKKVLLRMREANRGWQREVIDVGFIPEPLMIEISKNNNLYEYARSGEYNLERVMETAEMASFANKKDRKELFSRLHDKDPIVRFWAATGCVIMGEEAKEVKKELQFLTEDPEVHVRITAAEAIYQLGEKEKAMEVLLLALQSDNLMARVQSLNVLENMGEDAIDALNPVKQLLANYDPNSIDYDYRAADRLVKKLEKDED